MCRKSPARRAGRKNNISSIFNSFHDIFFLLLCISNALNDLILVCENNISFYYQK